MPPATFAEIPIPETTALLSALAPLLRRPSRRRSAPSWPADATTCCPVRWAPSPRWRWPACGNRATRSATENVLIGLRWASDTEGAAVIYIDHNMGSLVKDAFVIEDSADVVMRAYEQLAEPDTFERPRILALARARIEDAVRTWAMTVPPIESETWPAVRALVVWATEQLPEGEELPEWEPISDDVRSGLIDDFLASDDAHGLRESTPTSGHWWRPSVVLLRLLGA